MNNSKQILFLLLYLFIYRAGRAEKIEKKGTILNSNCNPIGTKCQGSTNIQITYYFVYNEPKAGSISIHIPIQEANKILALQKMLANKTHFSLEEPLELPEIMCKALGFASDYKIPTGTYPIRLQNNYYIILFKE
jgi:hypothetical protein